MSESSTSTDVQTSELASSQTRRRFLTAATSAVGLVGAVGVATPF